MALNSGETQAIVSPGKTITAVFAALMVYGFLRKTSVSVISPDAFPFFAGGVFFLGLSMWSGEYLAMAEPRTHAYDVHLGSSLICFVLAAAFIIVGAGIQGG